jgi:hypothetical protein
MRALTRTQLQYYFRTKYLKHFSPDCWVNLGNGRTVNCYFLSSIKKTRYELGIPLREKWLSDKPIDEDVIEYLQE